MSYVRLIASRSVSKDRDATACVGADEHDGLCTWFSLSPPGTPGTRLEVPVGSLLPSPAGLAPAEALRLLALWPSWRLARAAALAIGSRVAVIGVGDFGEQVARMCRTWGGLPTLVPSVNRGPQGWDALILTRSSAELAAALATCRVRGTVVLATKQASALELDVYPDLHRRGLSLVGIAPFESQRDLSAGWLEDASLLNEAIRVGRLNVKELLGQAAPQ